MIVGNIRSHADLARKLQMQKDLLGVEVSNEAELERRVKDYKNPYAPKAVPPKFKSRAELMRDVMELTKSLIDKFRDIDVPYEIARGAIMQFNNDPDSLVRLNALFPAIRRKILEATIPSLVTSEQILDVVRPILRRTELAYGFALDKATIKTPQELSLSYGIEDKLDELKNEVMAVRNLIATAEGKAIATETGTAIEVLTEAYPDTEFFELLEAPDITEEENHNYLEKMERAFTASSIPSLDRTTQLIAELEKSRDGGERDKIRALNLVRRAVSNATPEKIARLKAVVDDIKKDVEASRRDKERKNRDDDDEDLARNAGVIEGDDLIGVERGRKSVAQRELEKRRKEVLDEKSGKLTKDQRNLLRAFEIKLDEVIEEVGYNPDTVGQRLKEVTEPTKNPDIAQLMERLNREQFEELIPYIDDLAIKRGVGGGRQEGKPAEFAEEVAPPRFYRREIEAEDLVRPKPPFIDNARRNRIENELEPERDKVQRDLARIGQFAKAQTKATQDEREAYYSAESRKERADIKNQYDKVVSKIPSAKSAKVIEEEVKRNEEASKQKDIENKRFADLATQDLFATLGDAKFPKLNKKEKQVFFDVFGSKEKDEGYKVGVAREYTLLKAESQKKVDEALDIAEHVEVWNADLVADAKQPSMPVSDAQQYAEEAKQDMVRALASGGGRREIAQIIAEEKEELDGARFEEKVGEKPVEQVERVARNIRRDEIQRGDTRFGETLPPSSPRVTRPPPPPPRGATKQPARKFAGETLEDHEGVMEAQLQRVIRAELPEDLTSAQQSQIAGAREYFYTSFIQELTARPEEEQNALLRNIVIKIQTDTGKDFEKFLPPLKIFDRPLTEEARDKVFAGLERYYVARKVSEDFRYKPNVRGQKTRGRNSSDVEPLKKGIGMKKKMKKVEESDSESSSDDEMKKPIAHTKAFKASRIKIGKGIEVQEEPRYRTFGKYLVHMPQLRGNNLNFKYPKSLGTVPHLKSTPVSGEYRDFVIDVLDTGRMNEKDLRRLPEHEQKHFEKVVVGCGLVETFKLNKTTNKDEKTDADRFNLLRGEYLAGNNAPTLLKELRSFILKFMDDGRIKRKEGMGLLAELAVSI